MIAVVVAASVYDLFCVEWDNMKPLLSQSILHTTQRALVSLLYKSHLL